MSPSRKARAAGLRHRPLAETVRDTVEWRTSDLVPEPIRSEPRFVLDDEAEARLLEAWKRDRR